MDGPVRRDWLHVPTLRPTITGESAFSVLTADNDEFLSHVAAAQSLLQRPPLMAGPESQPPPIGVIGGLATVLAVPEPTLSAPAIEATGDSDAVMRAIRPVSRPVSVTTQVRPGGPVVPLTRVAPAGLDTVVSPPAPEPGPTVTPPMLLPPPVAPVAAEPPPGVEVVRRRRTPRPAAPELPAPELPAAAVPAAAAEAGPAPAADPDRPPAEPSPPPAAALVPPVHPRPPLQEPGEAVPADLGTAPAALPPLELRPEPRPSADPATISEVQLGAAAPGPVGESRDRDELGPAEVAAPAARDDPPTVAAVPVAAVPVAAVPVAAVPVAERPSGPRSVPVAPVVPDSAAPLVHAPPDPGLGPVPTGPVVEPIRVAPAPRPPARRSGIGEPMNQLPPTVRRPEPGDRPEGAAPPPAPASPPAGAPHPPRLASLLEPDLPEDGDATAMVAAFRAADARAAALGLPPAPRGLPPEEMLPQALPPRALPPTPEIASPSPVPPAPVVLRGVAGPAAGRAPGASPSTPWTSAPIRREPVPGEVRDELRQRHDLDVGRAEIVRGWAVDQEASERGARAFTRGTEVFLPDGAGASDQEPARSLVAHELTHVAQQQALGGAAPDEASTAGRQMEADARRIEARFQQGAATPAPSAGWPTVAVSTGVSLLTRPTSSATGVGPADQDASGDATIMARTETLVADLLTTGVASRGAGGELVFSPPSSSAGTVQRAARDTDAPPPAAAPLLPAPAPAPYTGDSGGGNVTPPPAGGGGGGGAGAGGESRWVQQDQPAEAEGPDFHAIIAEHEAQQQRGPSHDEVHQMIHDVIRDDVYTTFARTLKWEIRRDLRRELVVDRERKGWVHDA